MTLQTLRKRIDRLDMKLVRLLNERTRIALDIGRVKRAQGVAVYAPVREREVLERVAAHSRGPLSARAIQNIYREIMSASLALEGDLKVGVPGSPRDACARAARAQFGGSVDYRHMASGARVLRELQKGHLHCAIFPLPALARLAGTHARAFQEREVAVCASLEHEDERYLVVGGPSGPPAPGSWELALWRGARRPAPSVRPAGWRVQRVTSGRGGLWLLEGAAVAGKKQDAGKGISSLLSLGSYPRGHHGR